MVRTGLCVALCAAVTSTAGCSFTFVKRLPSHPQPGADCTSSYALPGADAVIGVLSGALAVTLFTNEQPASDATGDYTSVIAMSAGVMALALASAGYGAYQANRCRAATKPPPSTKYRGDGNTPAAGTLGGRCRADDSCDGALICDKPMHTCIRIDTGGGNGSGGNGSGGGS